MISSKPQYNKTSLCIGQTGRAFAETRLKNKRSNL